MKKQPFTRPPKDRLPAELRELLQSAYPPVPLTPDERSKLKKRLLNARPEQIVEESSACWYRFPYPWILLPLCSAAIFILYLSFPSSIRADRTITMTGATRGQEDATSSKADPSGPWFYTPNQCTNAVCVQRPECCTSTWDHKCDELLLQAGSIISEPSQSLNRLGRCYVHDRTLCPNCACPYYIKVVSDKGESVGYDYGTGCVQDRATLLLELKAFCLTASCE